MLLLSQPGHTQELFEKPPATPPGKTDQNAKTDPPPAIIPAPDKPQPAANKNSADNLPGQKSDTQPPPDDPVSKAPAGDPAHAATKTCLYCDQSEQLVVDLNYYKQIVDILKDIDNARKDISPTMLHSIHALLIDSHPALIDLLRTQPAKSATPAQPAKPAARTTAATTIKKPKPIKRTLTGIDGLTLKHVNENNPHTNTAARIIVDSNGKPHFLYKDSQFTHNNNTYRVTAIEKLDNDPSGRGHQVKIKNMKTNRTYTVPW